MAHYGDQMKKSVLVIGPALSRSGYGEQTRFALRALRSYENDIDVYVIPTMWGATGWIIDDTEERKWIDDRISLTQQRNAAALGYDASIQVDVPWAPSPQGAPPGNESGWKKLTNYDVGYTAGVETNKISPQWIERSQMMKKIIVVSDHSKNVFNDTVYTAVDRATGRQIQIQNKTPIDVVGFPYRDIPSSDSLGLNLKHDFNFLTVAQWCRRKNLENTILWFVEAFRDKPVGLVLKANLMKNCLMDRTRTARTIEKILENHSDRKCSVHLLHGHLTDSEMKALYVEPKIKAYLSLAHGEGFGIPMFDAVCSGMPVVTCPWSGQVDYLTMLDKKGRNTVVAGRVEFTIGQIQQDAAWKGILEPDSMWCYADQASAKKKMLEVFKKYNKYKQRAKTLQTEIVERFNQDTMHKKFVEATGILDLQIAPKEEGNLDDLQVFG